MLQELNASEWLEKAATLPHKDAENVLAYYEHRMGGYCRDGKLMLIPLDDHLVHRGDGVFEAMKVQHGKIYQLDPHIKRLQDSAAALSLTPPCPWEEIRRLLIAVTHAALYPASGEKLEDASLKLLMGRGLGGFGVDPRECPEASLYIIASKAKKLPESYWEKGLTAARSAVPAKQSYLARIKSTNYLPNAFMAMEAVQKHVDVTLTFDPEGFLAEAAIANIAVVDTQNRLCLPHFVYALPGTTAQLAMQVAEGFMPVVQMDIDEKMLEKAQEILLFGTSPDCVSLVAYEGKPIGNGKPGPVSRKLRALLQQELLQTATSV